MEDFLTVDELSAWIKFAKQSIYNMIHKKIFVKGTHYVKPSHKKILFKKSEVEKWIEGNRDLPSKPANNARSDNRYRINMLDVG